MSGNATEAAGVGAGVGRTALMVAAARAIETGRPDALAEDPYAEHFVRAAPAGRDWPVHPDQVPDGEADPLWGRLARYFGLRTRVLDDYLLRQTRAGLRQVVLLGAGLDTRALRLPWPEGCTVFEVDREEVLAFKQGVLDVAPTLNPPVAAVPSGAGSVPAGPGAEASTEPGTSTQAGAASGPGASARAGTCAGAGSVPAGPGAEASTEPGTSTQAGAASGLGASARAGTCAGAEVCAGPGASARAGTCAGSTSGARSAGPAVVPRARSEPPEAPVSPGPRQSRGGRVRSADAVVAAPARRVTVAADLRLDWVPALTAAGFDPALPTAWLAEGLLLYLPSAAERGLVETVDAHSAPGSAFAYEVKFGVESGAVRGSPVYREARDRIGVDLLALFDPEPRPDSAARLAERGWRTEVHTPFEHSRRLGRGPLPEPDDALGANRWVFATRPVP